MAKDEKLLILLASTQYTATGIIGAAVETEGGFRADVRLEVGAITTDRIHGLTIEVSYNGVGGTYYKIGAFPNLAVGNTLLGNIARSAYIPKVTPAMILAGYKTIFVRLYDTIVSGTTGGLYVSKVFVEPLVSLAPPTVDFDAGTGLEKTW